jgi:predicted amidohydrolase
MKISIIQPDICWENKPANFRKLENLITGGAAGADIIVLPEMFNTGFSIEPGRISEPPHSVTFDWMKAMADATNGAICGSYIVREKNKYFNRWVFVTPGHEAFQYDKRHLFSMGGEDKAFTPGEKRIIFSYKALRICPAICYDLRFPVWSRNRNDYDLLINSANWPSSRHSVWLTLLKARAIENQCYVAGANRAGSDGAGLDYDGDSVLIDPRGEIISTPTGNKECAVSGEISMDELSDFRKIFPVLKDADQFSIKMCRSHA